jgi:asparagine synthetase B (glutamine-hydrolysing)
LVELPMKPDQMSRAASIEVRVPFLDHELAEFTASIPAKYEAKYETKGFTGKPILKSAAEDLFPRDNAYRTEDGFPDAVGLLIGRGRSWITSSGFRPTWSPDGLPNIATDTVMTGIACGDFSLELGKILPGKRAD